MSCNKILICGSANISKKKLEIASSDVDCIIAADGGYDQLAAAQLVPDIIIGDMDSIKNQPDNIKNVSYPVDKDKSDLELSLDYAAENFQQCKEVILAGVVSETRLDHTFANILTASNYQSNVSIITDHSKLEVLNQPGKYTFAGNKEDRVSLITLRSGNLSTEGLDFQIDNKLSSPSHGISNRLTGSKFTINIKSGSHLLVTFA